MSSANEAEQRRQRIMARGTDRLKRLEQARLEGEAAAGGAANAGADAPAEPASPAPQPPPLVAAEHFPPGFPRFDARPAATPPLRQAQRLGDALTGEAPDSDSFGPAAGAQGAPEDPMALFAQLLGQMTGQGAGQQGGDPLAGLLGAPPGDQGPRQRRGQASQPGSQPQAQMPMDNPLAALLGANAPPGMASMLQNMMKPTHPAVAEMRAEEELRRKEELRRARPWRIVGILCSAAVALFALYLLATSGSVVDMGDVDADGDAQVGEYTGWRSGAARIARLRLGSSEVLDDLGAEAVGYPIWLIFLMSEVTLHLLRIGAASILDTSISTPPRPSSDRPPAAAGFFRRFGLVFTMLRDDLAAFVFVIGLGVVLASLV